GADRCVQAISSVGNPVVWWLGLLALVAILWMAIARRDWRAWVVLAGYAAVYVPWLAYAHRTIFTFYAIALAPYVALAVVVAVAWVAGLLPPLHGPARRPGEVPVEDDNDGPLPAAPPADDSWLTRPATAPAPVATAVAVAD